MPFQFAYNVANSSNSVPVAGTFPMSGATYNDGDLLKLDTSTGQMGTVAAGDPSTTVAAVFAGTRSGGTAGQMGTAYIITRDQVWKAPVNATTYSVNIGAGSVQVLNAGTISSTPGTATACRLYGQALDASGTLLAYVQFTTPVW